MHKESKIIERVGQNVEDYKKIGKEVIAAMTRREEDEVTQKIEIAELKK